LFTLSIVKNIKV